MKCFWPCIFTSDVVPFQNKEVGAFLAHGRQYRRMGLVNFVMSSQCFNHVQNKRKQRETVFFFFFFFLRMPDLSIVLGFINKKDAENGIALHRTPFLMIITQSE